MSILVSLAFSSLNDYMEKEPDTPRSTEIKKEMRIQIENEDWDEIEWEEILKKKDLCRLIYIALERWESIKFVGTELSISRIGDVRSMMSEIKHSCK